MVVKNVGAKELLKFCTHTYTFTLTHIHPLTFTHIHTHRCNYDPDSRDSCGVTPLMDAARGDHVPCLEFLLHGYGASLSAEDGLGRQAVHHAAQAGALWALKFLLENGADVNKTASINSITPLHYAAKVRWWYSVTPLYRHLRNEDISLNQEVHYTWPQLHKEVY